jgi:hypothetical protein
VRQEIRRRPIGFDRCFVEITGNGEKAFSPEEPTIAEFGEPDENEPERVFVEELPYNGPIDSRKH